MAKKVTKVRKTRKKSEKVKKLATVSVKKPRKSIYSTPLPEALDPHGAPWWSITARPVWASGVLLGACLVILIVVGIATS